MKSFVQNHIINYIKKYWKQDAYKATILRFITIGFRSAIAFIFWIVIGYFFEADGVGVLSSVVSVLRLGAIFTMFGIQTAFLKFPLYSFRKKQLFSISLIPLSLNFIAAIVFVSTFNYLRELLEISKTNWFFLTLLLTIIVSFFLMFDDILVGIKSPYFLLIKEAISTVSLFSGIFLIVYSNIPNTEISMLIVWGTSQLISVVVTSLFIIFKKREKPEIQTQTGESTSLRKFVSFSFNNHTGTLIQSLPMLLTAPLVIKLFNTKDAAFIYISWAILGMLASFPNSLSFVLVTERRDTTLKTLLSRFKFAFIIDTIIIIPLLALQKFIFGLFGLEFSMVYFWSFLLILLSIYPLSLFLIYISALRQRNEKGLLQLLFALQSGLYFASIFIFKPVFNLISVNFSWFISTLILSGVCIFLSIKKGRLE